jgi:hypothetical protein
MNTTTRATSRTWAAHHVDRECGVVVHVQTYTVTLARTAQGIAATVDGQPVDVLEADQILRTAARLEVTAETLEAPTIGKARAAKLHRLMGRAGLPSAQHYALAAAALGEWAPLPSLAELSEAEARTVWQHFARLYSATAA